MADRQEVEQYLKQYTEIEKQALRDLADPKNIVQTTLIQEKQQLIFVDGQFLTKGQNVGVYKNHRFIEVPEHRHNYIEFSYVWSGRVVQYINGEKIICQKGDVCILNTGTVHSIEKCGEDDIVINLLMRKEFFDYAFMSRLTKQGVLTEFFVEAMTRKRDDKNYLIFNTEKQHGFQQIIEEIVMEDYQQDVGMSEVLESYMIIIFTRLLRAYQADNKRAKIEKVDVRVLDLVRYIEKNYKECSLCGMARHFGLNPRYLTMLLKEKTGRSFVEHVQEQRLNHAKLLLINTDAAICEIVSDCGYQNMSFFYKKFKQIEGMTPAQYRKKA